jgi:hypothetical protein
MRAATWDLAFTRVTAASPVDTRPFHAPLRVAEQAYQVKHCTALIALSAGSAGRVTMSMHMVCHNSIVHCCR